MYLLYIFLKNRNNYFRVNLLLCVFKMPFYAVANGRVPGVYKTWSTKKLIHLHWRVVSREECLLQTKGFPQAKFKKFNSEREAIVYVETIKSSSSGNGSSDILTSTATSVENANPPELKALGKYSSQTLLKQDKLSMIAEKLDAFIEQTNKKLNEFSKRMDRLEACYVNESSEGKRKTDKDGGLEESNIAKKKKGLVMDGPVDDPETRRSLRNITKSVNVGVEEVDYPWGSGNNTSHSGFIVGPDGFTVVYTDGACSNNGRRGAKAGIGIWFNHNHPFNVAAPVEGNATNNNAEIQAAARAIDQATLAGIKRLNIHTDSQFMINCMTDWISKWKKNNWMTSAGGPVKNKEQLILLDRAIQRMDAVKWTHVRGHMGNEGNECADALAVRGATMYQPQ